MINSRLEAEITQILIEAEQTDPMVQEAVQQAEMIVAPTPPTRFVDRIREYRGVIMGSLGMAGGFSGLALAVAFFPDQHLSIYSMVINPQHGMALIGIGAGTSLGEVLTRS